MAVTTVSPSPASPTGGDNLCETDVTNVAIHSVTLLICLCGLVGNGAVLRLLSLRPHNAGILDLALADFLLLLFTVPANLLFLVEDVSCSPIMPLLYFRLLSQLSVVSCYWALFRLMFPTTFVFDMNFFDLHDICKFFCRCNIPPQLMLCVYTAQFWAFFALLTVIPAVTYLCPSHQQRHCSAALISVYAIILLLFAVPMVFTSKLAWEPEWAFKKLKLTRRNIVVFLIVVFILLLILCNFLQQLGYIVMSSEVFFLLNCIHSSIKPFIYFLAGGFQRPCSLGSLRLYLDSVFGEDSRKNFHRKDAPMDTESKPGDLFHCSAGEPSESAILGVSLSHPINENPQDPPTCGAVFLQEKGAGAVPPVIFEGCSAGSTLEHGFPPPSEMPIAPRTAAGLSSDPQLYSLWNGPHCQVPV